MERLKPLEKLESDYYASEGWRGCVESDDEMSSDDELQQELGRLAGIRNESMVQGRIIGHRSEFEDDMEDELDRSIKSYANEHMTVPIKTINDNSDEGKKINLSTPESYDDNVEMDGCHEKQDRVRVEGITPSSSKESFNQARSNEINAQIKDDENNLIRKLANETKHDMDQPDFYDEKEDDENERWVQERRSVITGLNQGEKNKGCRPRIDNGSDAVLSCPGCMVLLTRDCQRHEIYNDQYRAMFVENCKVDETEPLTIEKTGKEKRRLRQKMKKQGLDPSQIKDDLFFPVKCAVCTTKVAVMDQDEVYHFFNVLSGYS